MNRALLLSGALGELAKAGTPIVMIPVSSAIVRAAMDDVHDQIHEHWSNEFELPSNYRCPACDAQSPGPIPLFLHMLECQKYHQIVEPSTVEPF